MLVCICPLTNDLRFQRDVDRLCRCGNHTLGEFIVELAHRHRIESEVAERLAEWGRGLTPELVAVAGGTTWAPHLYVLPCGRR